MRTAVICGGGIAGLSAAIALAKKDWSVDVYERSKRIREIGAGIFVKGNALRVLEGFDLIDQVRASCVVLNEARTLDKDGQLLQRRLLRGTTSIWNVKRELLIRALYERAIALGARVHTDAPVAAIDASGAITVRGQVLRAELVIAADGVNSLARHSLGLDMPVRAPSSGAIRLLVPRSTPEAEDVVREVWSGRLRAGVCPCTANDAFCYFIAPLGNQRGSEIPIDVGYWSEKFPKLASEGLFERAHLSGGVHHPYPMVRTRAWMKGRVALLGDAAHALPPTLGQGAGLSLMNAVFLSDYVSSKNDVPEALAAWERAWRWVANRTQTWSRRYDWVTSEWPPAAYPLRDLIIRAIGKSPWLNGYIRIADRVDARSHALLPAAYFIAPLREEDPA